MNFGSERRRTTGPADIFLSLSLSLTHTHTHTHTHTYTHTHTHIYIYDGWNFNSGNYLFTSDMKIDTCFEVLLSFNVVTSIVYNPLPAMWKS